MRAVLVAVVALVAGCSTQTVHEGISVGNPSLTTLTTARSTGVTLTTGDVRLHGVGVRDEDGTVHRTYSGDMLDLLGDDAVEIPAGAWRRVTLHFSGDVHYQGIHDDGTQLDVRLAVSEVVLFPDDVEMTVDGGGFIAELAFPDWLDLAEPVTQVAVGTPLHDQLAQSVRDSSALYIDNDEDGQLSSEERDERAAAGTERVDR